MAKAPSEKTQIASLKREIRALRDELLDARRGLSHYRARATSAEQAAAEWKTRFDKLLEFRKLAVTE